MSNAPKVKNAQPTWVPMTETERMAVEGIMSRQAVLQQQIDTVANEARARLGLANEVRMTFDPAQARWGYEAACQPRPRLVSDDAQDAPAEAATPTGTSTT